MSIWYEDVVPLSRARAKLTELCEEVHSKGTETLLTKNRKSCAALISAERLDYYHQLEREHIHLQLLQESIKGVDDLEAGKTHTLGQMKSRHGMHHLRPRAARGVIRKPAK